MNKRISRLVMEVAQEVRAELKDKHGLTDKELQRHQERIKAAGHKFPIGLALLPIDQMWIDYEVQRDVIVNHVLKIIRKFDPRIVGAASCVRFHKSKFPDRYYAYDGQHRTLAMAILGYTEVPACYVETEDERFASQAFEILNHSGSKKILTPDLHRIRLNLYAKGSTDEKSNILARRLQDQFDKLKIDLQETSKRKSPKQCGPNFHWYSHFESAYKAIEADPSGQLLHDALDAIQHTWPNDDHIDQGVLIGLTQQYRWNKDLAVTQPADWMRQLLAEVGRYFSSSLTAHRMASQQWTHAVGSGSWSAPQGMGSFLREIYKLNPNATLTLPYKGTTVGIADRSNICAALKPALEIQND